MPAPHLVVPEQLLDKLKESFIQLVEASMVTPARICLNVDNAMPRIKVNLRCEGAQASPAAIQSLIQRLSGSANTDSDRAGRLRMPLARRIVESHHGEVVISYSEKGELLFEVYLPKSTHS